MRCRTLVAAAIITVQFVAGCAASAHIESQRVQVAAMEQHAREMQTYHEKVRQHLLAAKTAELERALAASLAREADDARRVTIEAVLEKVRKRDALAEGFRDNLRGLDAQFEGRQKLIRRATLLGRETLRMLEAWGRLPAAVRALFVREPEMRGLIRAYETERSSNHGRE